MQKDIFSNDLSSNKRNQHYEKSEYGLDSLQVVTPVKKGFAKMVNIQNARSATK